MRWEGDLPGFKRGAVNHLRAPGWPGLKKVFRLDRLPQVLLLNCDGCRLVSELVDLVWFGLVWLQSALL